LNNVIYWST